MISLDKNFVFIHINKTGGTSIVDALSQYETLQDLLLDHDHALLYRQRLGTALWSELFSFAFLRNPWDRMISSYEFRRQYIPDRRAPHVVMAAKLSFRDWMLGPVYDDPLDREWSNQLWMVQDEEQNIIVSQLYLYEQLEEGFQDACSRIGIPTPQLPQFNKTKRLPRREDYYDADTSALVRERFSADLAWAEETFPGVWTSP